jgi:hypothetical protein
MINKSFHPDSNPVIVTEEFTAFKAFCEKEGKLYSMIYANVCFSDDFDKTQFYYASPFLGVCQHWVKYRRANVIYKIKIPVGAKIFLETNGDYLVNNFELMEKIV